MDGAAAPGLIFFDEDEVNVLDHGAGRAAAPLHAGRAHVFVDVVLFGEFAAVVGADAERAARDRDATERTGAEAGRLHRRPIDAVPAEVHLDAARTPAVLDATAAAEIGGVFSGRCHWSLNLMLEDLLEDLLEASCQALQEALVKVR